MGVERLPGSLDRALERFAGEPVVKGWFPGNFVDIYLKHKQQEIADAGDMDDKKLIECYSAIY
jgi:glutamine synthetase